MSSPTLNYPNAPLPVPKQAPLPLLWMARLVALTAAAIAGYLLWASVTAGAKLAGCADDGGFGCDAVLSSRWSSWLGLPVGLPAVIVYLTLFATLWGIGPRASERTARDAWRVLIPLATLAAGAASWFSALQLFELHKMCPYCVGVHSCGIALAAFVFWYAPLRWLAEPGFHRDDPVSMRPLTAALLLVLGLAGVGVLIGGQALGTVPETELQITQTPPLEPKNQNADPGANGQSAASLPGTVAPNTTPPMSAAGKTPPPQTAPPKTTSPAVIASPPTNSPKQRRIALLGGKATLDVYKLPILGSPAADAIVFEMFDYTCHHCRFLHHLMREARRRYGSQLGIVLLPNPMNSSCNRYVKVDQAPHREACHYARLALAVWNAKPEMFEEYHDWLMDAPTVPTVEDARDKAADLIGEAALSTALADKLIGQQIEANGMLYHQAQHGPIPKLMTDKFVQSGQPQNAEQLFQMLENRVGVRPLAGTSD